MGNSQVDKKEGTLYKQIPAGQPRDNETEDHSCRTNFCMDPSCLSYLTQIVYGGYAKIPFLKQAFLSEFLQAGRGRRSNVPSEHFVS